jgi:hypothetical protein
MKPTAATNSSSRSIQDRQQRVIEARLTGSSSRIGSMMTPIVLSRRRPRGSGMNRQELALLLDEALALTANVDIDSNLAKKPKDNGLFHNIHKRDDLK